jgi:hypothetical protein
VAPTRAATTNAVENGFGIREIVRIFANHRAHRSAAAVVPAHRLFCLTGSETAARWCLIGGVV